MSLGRSTEPAGERTAATVGYGRSMIGRALSVVVIPLVAACGVGSTLPMATIGDAGFVDAGPPRVGCDEGLAAFDLVATELTACAQCHQFDTTAPDKREELWGVGGPGTKDTWHTASLWAVFRPEQLAVPPRESDFFLHFAGIDAIHAPRPAATQDAVAAWIDVVRPIPTCDPANAAPTDGGPVVDAGFPDAGFVDAGFVDAGPPPLDAGCRLPDDDSLAIFTTEGLAGQYDQCASCHETANTPAGVGQDWGVAASGLGAAEWHAAAKAVADRATTTVATEVSLYTHFNGSDTIHPVDVAARDSMLEWLNAYLPPVDCGGGPVDGGPVDGG